LATRRSLSKKVLDRLRDGPLLPISASLGGTKARYVIDKYSSVGAARMAGVIQGLRQGASWCKVRWQSEKAQGPFARKQPDAAQAAKVCVARRLQRAKREAISRKTLIQPNWPVT